MDLLNSILGFVGKKTQAAGRGIANTAGMAKDYIDYSRASNPDAKYQEAVSYNKRRKEANDAMKQFGFDAGKEAGQQFDPIQFGKGTMGGGGEIASLLTPVKGKLAQRLAVNAIPGFTNAVADGKGIGGITGNTILSSILGTGGEKLVKGAGGLMKGSGNKLADLGENLGLRRFGLTKMDVNKLNQQLGEPVQDFLKKNNLIGKSADDLTDVIKPLQESFDSIANRADLKIDPNDLKTAFSSKISELKNQSAPELVKKGQGIEEYLTNYLNKSGQDFSAKGVTGERRVIDQLVKDFGGQGGDAFSASKNKVIRDTLQDAVRTAADKAGIKGMEGKSLKELGGKLSKMYSFEDIATKRAPQSTGLPAGIVKSILSSGGAGVGGMLGGVPGAVLGGGIGLASEAVANNPKVIQSVAQNAPKLGANLVKGGEKLANNGTLLKAMQMLGLKTGNVVSDMMSGTPQGVNNDETNNYNNAYASENVQSVDSTNNPASIPQQGQDSVGNQNFVVSADKQYKTDQNTGAVYSMDDYWRFDPQQDDWVPNEQAPAQSMGNDPQEGIMAQQQQIQGMMEKALQAGDIKGFTQLAAVNENVMQMALQQQKFEEAQDPKAKGKALPQTAVQELSDLDDSNKILTDLATTISTNKDKFGPIMGRINESNKFDDTSQTVQAELQIAAQIIGKALEGGKLAEGDINRYKAMLPKMTDSEAVAANKIKILQNKLKNKKEARLKSYNESGFSNQGLMDQNELMMQAISQMQ